MDTTSAQPRPQLRPGIVPLWRDESTVQFGLDPDDALVVGGVDQQAIATLRSLDGTHTRAQVRNVGGRSGRALLDLLDEHSLLDDLPDADPMSAVRAATFPAGSVEHTLAAPELAALTLRHGTTGARRTFAARRAARVHIVGGARVGIAAAQVLAASGLGRVDIDDDAHVDMVDVCPGGAAPAHVGLRRRAAGVALTVRTLPPAVEPGPPDLVVFAPAAAGIVDEENLAAAYGRGAAVLPVTLRQDTVVVGPLYAPSVTSWAGCPRCRLLHRTDRDPQWQTVARQFLAQAAAAPPVASVWAAVAAATSQVLAWIDGGADHERTARSRSAGASLELEPGDWIWRRRWWGPHPQCGCRTT